MFYLSALKFDQPSFGVLNRSIVKLCGKYGVCKHFCDRGKRNTDARKVKGPERFSILRANQPILIFFAL